MWQSHEVEVSVSQSGLAFLNGFYRPTLISISSGLHEKRKVVWRGNGPELQRLKHVTAPFYLVCTTVLVDGTVSPRKPVQEVDPGSVVTPRAGGDADGEGDEVPPPTIPTKWTFIDDNQVASASSFVRISVISTPCFAHGASERVLLRGILYNGWK